MKVSYKWLQTYFKDPLPTSENVSELFTFHAFEVEGVETVGTDSVLDVKVLPDRANYALSHRGIARELAVILNKNLIRNDAAPLAHTDSKVFELEVQDARCRRDSMAIVQNVTIAPSPEWLKEKLEVLGQRSINNIVDATNYVMLDMGQPLHAFDFDKLTKKDGKIKLVLTKAEMGQKITILGGKKYELDADTLIFADGNNNNLPLDIAGIKGGTAAEVDAKTKNIILLSANFDSTYIRKTSTKLGIKTDAVKRSENGIPLGSTMIGLSECVELIASLSPLPLNVEGIVDWNPYHKDVPENITVSARFINDYLGVVISDYEIEDILTRFNFSFMKHDDHYVIVSPSYRLDINTPEDIVEEIGRMYGYEKLAPVVLQPLKTREAINKTYYYMEKIKDFLVAQGFSEVITYALTNTGEVEIQNPLASDKNFLRAGLREGLQKSLELNAKNSDYLEVDQIKMFEIGKIFNLTEETTHLAIGIQNVKKSKIKEPELVQEIISKLSDYMGVDFTEEIITQKALIQNSPGKIIEIDLDDVIAGLPEPKEWDLEPMKMSDVKYKKISPYPYAVRDIAVFVPESVTEQDLRKIITDKSGSLLIKNRLFDVFKKQQEDGNLKISYAFRLVFQSYEKTLTEEEINLIMTAITTEMNGRKEWQVR